jgi:hypothetical protein
MNDKKNEYFNCYKQIKQFLLSQHVVSWLLITNGSYLA